MDRKRRLSRLGGKLAGVSVLGLALAFAIFYLADSVAAPWLFYSERFASFWRRRDEAAVQAYQDYVTENGLTIRQAMDSRVDGMADLTADFYTFVVGAVDSSPLSSASVDEDVGYSLTWADYGGQSSQLDLTFVTEVHQIQCADGTLYLTSTPAALRYEGMCRVAGLLLALLAFCAVMVPCIVRLVRRHDTPVLPEEKQLKRLLQKLGEEDVRRLIALQKADTCGQAPACRERLPLLEEAGQLLDALLHEEACFSLRELAVNGSDLLALGLRGRAIGTALNACLAAVLDGAVPNERTALLQYVQDTAER